MADAMDIEDSDSSDTVEYDVIPEPPHQLDQEVPPEQPASSSSIEYVSDGSYTVNISRFHETATTVSHQSTTVPHIRTHYVNIPRDVPISQPPSMSLSVPPTTSSEQSTTEPHVTRHYVNVPQNVPISQPPSISQSVPPTTSSKQSTSVTQNSTQEQPSISNRNPGCNEDDDDEGITCPICLEVWTSSGDHRICSLKCGHLFGYKCVQRWLDSQRMEKSCPTCKKKVRRSDLRFIYAKKLIAADNVELETIKFQLQEALAEKNRIAQDLHRYASREQVLLQEIILLKEKVHKLSIGSNSTNNTGAALKNSQMVRLYMDKSINICSLNDCRECRVFDINVTNNRVSVGSRSATGGIFGLNFGLKQIDLKTYKNVQFLALHEGPIRDLSFHESEPWILTASTDKSFRVTDPSDHRQSVHRAKTGSPLWSCCWGPSNNRQVVLGCQNGSVQLYDLRNTSRDLITLSVERDLSPVVSVAAVKGGPYSDVPQGAIIACKLNSIWAFENQAADTYQRHSLPLEGPFLTLRYDNNTKQLLSSARPNSQMNYVRHTLCNLQKVMDPETIKCNIVHTFRSGAMAKYLARGSCFVPPDYVAGLHEAKKRVILYSMHTGEEVTSIPAHSTILDLKGFETANGSVLGVLTEEKMEFFKFV